MSRCLALILACGLAACSVREVEPEPESRRNLADDWCADYCASKADCDPPTTILTEPECLERCVADEAWDWTDECGDIRWAFRECVASTSCEEDFAYFETPPHPCLEHMHEFSDQGCSYQ